MVSSDEMRAWCDAVKDETIRITCPGVVGGVRVSDTCGARLTFTNGREDVVMDVPASKIEWVVEDNVRNK